MGVMTRRSVVATAASGGVALAMPGWLRSAQAQPRINTRYSATSPQGKDMLKRYARAVDIMVNRVPKGDPRHWDFQWYSHWIPGPQSPWDQVVAKKNQTLQAVYNGRPPSDPHRRLAEIMWDGCQAHGSNPNDPSYYQEQFFLPWHRYFVYYFEEIIRGLLQDASFTLPYWDYLGGSPASTVIPPEFRDTASPLYRADRNPGVNAGQPVDVGPGRTRLNSLAFRETVYIKTTPPGNVGFCPILDGNPHGAVHVDVGTPTNMGRVPYAGGDPIFWLHHCNIDRLWESWNRIPGRNNPVWPTRSFTFANANGGAVIAPVAGANRVALLHYQYENYYVPPGTPVALAAPEATLAATSPSEVQLIATPLALTSGTVSAPLATPGAALAAGPPVRLAVPAEPRSLYLILGGIDAMADPGQVVYNVYLDLPEGTKPTEDDPHYVGSLNFFNAAVGHDHGGDQDGGHHTIAFNVTDVVKTLQAGNKLSEKPTVTLTANGELNSDAKPTVNDIALVEA